MTTRRTTALITAGALAAAGLAVAATSAIGAANGGVAASIGSLTPSSLQAGTVNLVADGGFEATEIQADGNETNSYWESWDTAFDAGNLCVGGGWCGAADTTDPEGPHEGNGWVWFGYTGAAHSTAYVKQTVSLPGGGVTLSYTYRNGTVDAPFDAQLVVKLDGVEVNQHDEGTQPMSGYRLFTVDIPSTEAGDHELSFGYDNGSGSSASGGYNDMTIDNVSILPVG